MKSYLEALVDGWHLGCKACMGGGGGGWIIALEPLEP
jgi:hypothetical protein